MFGDNQPTPFEDRMATGKALGLRLPERLMDIDARVTKAYDGLYVLGDLDATYQFCNGFINALHDQGWPIFRRDKHGFLQRELGTRGGIHMIAGVSDVLRAMTDPASRVTLGGKRLDERAHRRDSLGCALAFSDDYEGAVEFLQKEENMVALEKSVNNMLAEVTREYGDPLAVRAVRKSLLKPVFNALNAHNPFSRPDAETRLVRSLKEGLLPLMRHFNALQREQWVPGLEFQRRMEDQLRERGWNIGGDGDKHSRLQGAFWGLASLAEARTTLPIRLSLQDGTNPPCPWKRKPQDFILAHVDDIQSAATSVADELRRELASPEGVQYRHVQKPVF